MTEPRPDPAGPEAGDQDGTPRSAVLRRFLPLLVLIAGLLTILALGGHRYISFDALEAHREELLGLVDEHGGVAIIAFIAAYAVLVAFSVPGGLVMTVAGGFLFGTLLGAAGSVVGATLGALAVFLAARTALGDLLRDRAGPALARMREGFRKDALSYLLVLRLIPLFPFWLVNLVPAFLGVSFRVFLLGTFLGIIPASLVYASIGNGLAAIFEAGKTDEIAGAIYQPEVLLPLAGLIALSLLPVLYKKVKARRNGGNDPGSHGDNAP